MVVKLDDLGPARRARLHVQGAPLGDRLQVPARGAHHAAARHPGVDRPHRARPRPSPCSSRCSSAAPPSAWPRCTTRTRWRPRTSARATPSSCARPATSSPRSSGPVLSAAPGGPRGRGRSPRRARSATAPLAAARGRERHVLHQRRLPGPAGGAHRALRQPRGDGHRGLRRAAGPAVPRARPAGRPRRHLLPRLERVRALEGFGALSVANLAGRHRGLQGPPAGQPARRPQHPPPRRRRRRSCWPGHFGHLDRIVAASEEEMADGRGHRADDRRLGGAASSPTSTTGPSSRSCAAAGVNFEGPGRARRAPDPGRARRSWSPARSSATAGRRPRRPSRPGAASRPAASRRRPPPSWWVPSRAPPS